MRALLVMLAVFGLAFAAWQSFHNFHRIGAEREIAAKDKYVLDIHGYETESSLPSWINRWLPDATRQDFEHITEIDLQFNNLSACDPQDVVDLHACAWVHTLRVSNATMSQEMFDAVIGFPKLRKLYVRDWFDRVPSHEVKLEMGLFSGINIVLE